MVRVTLRLPDDLHRRLREKSEEGGTSLNQTIVNALEDALPPDRLVWDESLPLDEKLRLVRAPFLTLWRYPGRIYVHSEMTPALVRPDGL